MGKEVSKTVFNEEMGKELTHHGTFRTIGMWGGETQSVREHTNKGEFIELSSTVS